MGRKRKNNKEAKVHEELAGLDLRINEFGEIQTNIDIDKINKFLNKGVPDKKLINRLDNKYQQEFKDKGITGEGEDDEPPFIEEHEDEKEDDFDKLMKDE